MSNNYVLEIGLKNLSGDIGIDEYDRQVLTGLAVVDMSDPLTTLQIISVATTAFTESSEIVDEVIHHRLKYTISSVNNRSKECSKSLIHLLVICVIPQSTYENNSVLEEILRCTLNDNITTISQENVCFNVLEILPRLGTKSGRKLHEQPQQKFFPVGSPFYTPVTCCENYMMLPLYESVSEMIMRSDEYNLSKDISNSEVSSVQRAYKQKFRNRNIQVITSRKSLNNRINSVKTFGKLTKSRCHSHVDSSAFLAIYT